MFEFTVNAQGSKGFQKHCFFGVSYSHMKEIMSIENSNWNFI